MSDAKPILGEDTIFGRFYYQDTDYAALEAELAKLAEVLGDVEREHALIRQMKNCEIQRGRRSFGIAVMSDPPALEWQALDKELQKLIDARHAALASTPSAPKADDPVKQMLLEALEDVVAWAYRNTKWDCIPIALVRAQCAIAAARKGEV